MPSSFRSACAGPFSLQLLGSCDAFPSRKKPTTTKSRTRQFPSVGRRAAGRQSERKSCRDLRKVDPPPEVGISAPLPPAKATGSYNNLFCRSRRRRRTSTGHGFDVLRPFLRLAYLASSLPSRPSPRGFPPAFLRGRRRPQQSPRRQSSPLHSPPAAHVFSSPRLCFSFS